MRMFIPFHILIPKFEQFVFQRRVRREFLPSDAGIEPIVGFRVFRVDWILKQAVFVGFPCRIFASGGGVAVALVTVVPIGCVFHAEISATVFAFP